MAGVHDSPFGALPFGDYLGSAGTYPIALLTDDPSKLRSWLFDAYPRNPDTSTDPVTTIRVSLSSDGHKRYPADAEERQFPQALIQPFNHATSLGNRLSGLATVDQGEVIIGDAGNWHRTIAGYDWYGRQVDIYLGPHKGYQSQFTKVAQFLSRGRRFSRDQISIPVDDYSFIFGRLLQTNYYAGTGGLEGPASLKDNAKPVLIGQVDQIEPVAVDSTNFIYQIHDGDLGDLNSVDAVYDQMSALSFDADYADITTATPGVGEYSTSLAQGMIKLQAAPNGVVTVAAKGIESPTYGYVDSVSEIIKMLAIDFTDGDLIASNLDIAAFDQLETDFNSTLGWYFRQPGKREDSLIPNPPKDERDLREQTGITLADVMEIFLTSTLSFAQMLPDKTLTVGRITDPTAASADYTLDASKDELSLGPFDWSPFEVPVERVIVGYNRYQKTLDTSEISIRGAELEDYASEYRWTSDSLTGNDAAQNDDYKTLVIRTAIFAKADADLLADDLLNLRSVPRDVGNVALPRGLLKYRIGNIIQLADDRIPDTPKKFVVLGVRNSTGAEQTDMIELTLYGSIIQAT